MRKHQECTWITCIDCGYEFSIEDVYEECIECMICGSREYEISNEASFE